MTAAIADQSVLERRVAELMLRFVNGLPARFASIAQALSRAGEDPGVMEALARQFHSLAGTAGTYGVSGIADLAAQAEAICSGAATPARLRTIRYLIGAMQDVPPMRLERDDALGNLLRAAFDGLLIHDCERIIEVNASCAQMFGYGVDEMTGMPLRLLIDSAFLGVSRQETQCRRKDGTSFHAEISSAATGEEGHRIVAIRDISERKAIEQSSRDSDENFRLLCQAAFDGVMIHDDGIITAINDKCATMFGIRAEDAIGRSILEFTHPSIHETVLRRVRERSAEPFEGIGIRSDGTAVPMEICGVTKEGTSTRIVALKDLTATREAQEQLVESELRYRELLESSHELICEHDLDGRIIAANAPAAHALEISLEDLCGMDIRTVVAPEHRDEFDEYLKTIRANGVAEGLMMIMTRSGKRRIWHYQNTLRRSGVDHPIVRGRARDVTDREEALRALHRSERRFRSIIENASDVIVILDPAGTISYHSPSTARVLGYGAGELEGRHYQELIHPEERERTHEHFAGQIADPHKVRSGDFRVLHRDGSWRWISVTSSCVVSAGEVQSLIVNARDITDRLLLEQQLEQANRLTSLGRLTATVAHEFNNVLMSMQPFADLMQRGGVKPEVVAKGARHIANSIARGKRVAMDMLRFTRPAVPTMARVELQDWWEHFAPGMLATTRDNIRISWSCPSSLAIVADATQLSQVFANLISNGRDAMPFGGNLTLRCQVPRAGETFSFGVVPDAHTFVQISVHDTGTGMPEHVLRHAFDPLFTTKQNSGTGLGLAVAHQVVAKHGGFIFAESTIGAGTTFHIFLPRAGETAVVEQIVEETEPEVRVRRVLLVEDEPGIREGVADALNERGMVVAAVEMGRDAIPALTTFAPQLAIVDIGLPDMCGLDVGRMIRKRDPALKIIFASGHGNVGGVLDECAPAMFLQKPFEVRELLEAIAALEREEDR